MNLSISLCKENHAIVAWFQKALAMPENEKPPAKGVELY